MVRRQSTGSISSYPCRLCERKLSRKLALFALEYGVKGKDERLVFQAVHMVMDGDFQRDWKPDEKRYSRIVFIGRNLDETELQLGFAGCVA